MVAMTNDPYAVDREPPEDTPVAGPTFVAPAPQPVAPAPAPEAVVAPAPAPETAAPEAPVQPES